MSLRTHFTNAASMRRHLDDLYLEHATAERAGLLHNDTYRSHLDDEITFLRSAFVGAAVTEIASLRAQLGGPQQG